VFAACPRPRQLPRSLIRGAMQELARALELVVREVIEVPEVHPLACGHVAWEGAMPRFWP